MGVESAFRLCLEVALIAEELPLAVHSIMFVEVLFGVEGLVAAGIRAVTVENLLVLDSDVILTRLLRDEPHFAFRTLVFAAVFERYDVQLGVF